MFKVGNEVQFEGPVAMGASRGAMQPCTVKYVVGDEGYVVDYCGRERYKDIEDLSPVPKLEYEPFTFETFPRGVVYARNFITNQADYLICEIHINAFRTESRFWEYQSSLREGTEISTDLCKTWKPCGVPKK